MATLHTMTRVGESEGLAWRAFRAASMSGGTSPEWTGGEDDPQTWTAPPDAAGGLVLRDGVGWRAEPPPTNGRAMSAIVSALDAGEAVGLPRECIRGAYFSSGGAGIFAVEVDGFWFVYVARDGEPRTGYREESITRLCPDLAPVLL